MFGWGCLKTKVFIYYNILEKRKIKGVEAVLVDSIPGAGSAG